MWFLLGFAMYSRDLGIGLLSRVWAVSALLPAASTVERPMNVDFERYLPFHAAIGASAIKLVANSRTLTAKPCNLVILKSHSLLGIPSDYSVEVVVRR